MSSRRTSVINISGDFEESLQRLARHLGKNKIRRKVFDDIYGRGTKPKSKKQIMASQGIEVSKSQQVQNALEHLFKHHLINREESKGQVSDGSRFVYSKDETIRANKDLIRKLADDASLANKLPTKRNPNLELQSNTFSFSKKAKTSSVNRPKRSKKNTDIRLKIAFMVSNPDNEAKLRADKELKSIDKRIRFSGNRDEVDLRPYLAASVDDLLDSLNEFRPDVIHFSGHGGHSELVFDEDYVLDTSSYELDFSIITAFLDAVSNPPTLIFLNACHSSNGAVAVLSSAKFAIGMNDEIFDDAALMFSSQFYAALVAGEPISSAFDQAKLVLKMAKHPNVDVPELKYSQDVNPKTFKMI